jgi:hypothetical protein
LATDETPKANPAAAVAFAVNKPAFAMNQHAPKGFSRHREKVAPQVLVYRPKSSERKPQ